MEVLKSFIIQQFDLNAHDNMSPTPTDESAVIPGMAAVFLADMTRNPGIWCRRTGFPRSRE